MSEVTLDAQHVWPMEVVRSVHSLRAQCFVAQGVRERAARVMQVARMDLAKQIIQAARAWGVEASAGDMRFVERWWGDAPEEERAVWPERTHRITARWEPRVRAVVLRGGLADGTLLEVRDVTVPVLVAESQPIDWSDPPEMVCPSPRNVPYVLSGWSERERRWVLSPS